MAITFKLRPGVPDTDIKSINDRLASAGVEDHFITAAANQAWLDDINGNPASPQAHLKPKDDLLTMPALMGMFKPWTAVGEMPVDVAYERCSPSVASKIVGVLRSEPLLLKINGDSDAEKFFELALEDGDGVSKADIDALKSLVEVELPPQKDIRWDKRKNDLPAAGVAMLSGYGPDGPRNSIHVLFGCVDRPVFMKTGEYLDPDMNGLHRDALGRSFMLVPLMPVGKGSANFLLNTYRAAAEIGLRCHPLVFFAAVYGVAPICATPIDSFRAEDASERDILYAISRLTSMFARKLPVVTLRADKRVIVGINRNETEKSNAVAAFGNLLVRHHGYSVAGARDIINKGNLLIDRLAEIESCQHDSIGPIMS